MKIAVCDDQINSLEHVMTQVGIVFPECEAMPFDDVSKLFRKIEDGAEFDAILMDIEWEREEKRGIDFAEELYTLSPKSKIIFITGYPDRYSQQIFLKNVNLKGFVTKPVNSEILSKTLEKIQEEIAFLEGRKLMLMFNGVVTIVEPNDILYIESRAHTATVYEKKGSHLCYEKLDDLAKRLPGQFILPHKSFLVNMDNIRRIERGRIILEKGMEVPISKARYNEVRDYYFRYIGASI